MNPTKSFYLTETYLGSMNGRSRSHGTQEPSARAHTHYVLLPLLDGEAANKARRFTRIPSFELHVALWRIPYETTLTMLCFNVLVITLVAGLRRLLTNVEQLSHRETLDASRLCRFHQFTIE